MRYLTFNSSLFKKIKINKKLKSAVYLKGVPLFLASTSENSVYTGHAQTLLQEKPTSPMTCKAQTLGFLPDS